MKDWLTMTLFRRWGVFASRVAVAGALLVVTGTTSAASEYSVGIINCTANPATIPDPVPPLGAPGSPVPVGLAGGDSKAGAGAYAGADLRGHAYGGSGPIGFLGGLSSGCGSHPRAVHQDIFIQGPGAFADVTLHLPFHANIHQNWDSVFDLRVGHLESSNIANLFFTVALGGAAAQANVTVNRAADTQRVTLNNPAVARLVPRPRDPNAILVDSDGLITRFFRNVLPLAGGPIVGFDFTEIVELRGEMILTVRVPTNQQLALTLDMDATTSASPADSIGAFGALTQVTFGVPTDGSVAFEMPPGFTVDAPSLGIVNGTTVPPIFTCPITTAGWRGRPASWPVPFLALGTQLYSENDMLALLQAPVGALRPDASLSLAQQVIAARLNEENGAAPGPMIQPAVTADALFSTFTGPLPYHVDPRTALGQQMMNLALALSRYNAGQLTAPQCVP